MFFQALLRVSEDRKDVIPKLMPDKVSIVSHNSRRARVLLSVTAVV